MNRRAALIQALILLVLLVVVTAAIGPFLSEHLGNAIAVVFYHVAGPLIGLQVAVVVFRWCGRNDEPDAF